MPAEPRNIFDHQILSVRRKRVVAQDIFCDFLCKTVSAQLIDRLATINRECPRIACLGSLGDQLTRLLRNRQGTKEVITVGDGFADAPDMLCDHDLFPFKDAALDAVISCLDLQWVNDVPGFLAQVRHALKSDGFFLAALPGGETLKELRDALMTAELSVTGGVSPRVSPFIDIKDMGALLQRAGFALPVVDQDRIIVDYDHPIRLMHDLRGMAATNALQSRQRSFTHRRVMIEAMRLYQDKYADEDGRVPATFDILYIIGWAPDASQPQPLKRGSGQTSLVNILTSAPRSAGN